MARNARAYLFRFAGHNPRASRAAFEPPAHCSCHNNGDQICKKGFTMKKTTEIVVRNDKKTGFKSVATGLVVMAVTAPAFALDLTSVQAEVDSIPALVAGVAAGVLLIALTIKGFKWARQAFS